MIITVIIPTYNRAGLLQRAIRSILRQQADGAEFDILIIDDGSTDVTRDVCANLSTEHSNLRVIRQENQGVAAARNTGLRNLRTDSEIVTFLDSDDVFPAGRFSADLPHFAANPSLDLTYGRLLQVAAIDDKSLEPVEGCACSNVRVTQMSCGLYRRRILEQTGTFDEDMVQAEDTDYLLRLFEEGPAFRETDIVTIYYVRHDGNMTNDQTASRRFTHRAMLRSIQRRRAEPWRSMRMPTLEGTLLPPTA